jgi:aminoglycoside phosphotransferase (APT) family kinase protein
MPEPLGAIFIGTCRYMFMSYLEGVTLAELWPQLTPDLKTSVQSQLGEILQCLRKVPLQSKYLGSGNPPHCRELRRHVRISPESISNEIEFNAFLTSTQRELNPLYRELLTSKLGTGHQIVMTHSDIRPQNILVRYTAPRTIKITGLIDWEVSGAYPEYWEYVKALNGVNCDLSDWYSYLPTEVIGNHSDAWRQDMLVSRMVL